MEVSVTKTSRFKLRWPLLVGLATIAGVAYAATQISIGTPIALSDGGNGDKPKIQRAGDGTLVVVYGDSPAGAQLVYDTKGQVERPARDIFVKTCKPDASKSCDNFADWSVPKNLSNSALTYSIETAWQGGDPVADRKPFYGDIDKANIKTSGPVMVVTWVGNYCPDGDPAADGVQPTVQRAIRYLERDSRIIPFACTWMAHSTNSGTSWSAPKQLSSGERDAKQDSSAGGFNSVTRKGQVNISWQEDPQGLQLGEADGPGDGASGANVNGGTDVWYTWATIDLSVPATQEDDFKFAAPSGVPGALAYRLTDNWEGLYGLGGQLNPIFGGDGLNVDPDLLEKGRAGASRANIGMVGSTAIVAYEETKGSEGLDEGKFVRYHAFPFNAPPATVEGKAGCIISNPLKNARRVRFLTQSPTDAGPGGVNIAVFWKEGIYDKGGPSDIVVRRGMTGPNSEPGLQPANMVPAVSASCATSDYAAAVGLSQPAGENISSRAPSVTVDDNGLADDTELSYTENALAHRGVLRGTDLWIGYNYTADLVKLWAQLDNYNFWVRKFTLAGGWELPRNVTNVEDKRINVREPRFFGTPNSNANPGFCDNADPALATKPEFCQNRDVVFLAWGTQENVSPYDPDGGEDLGIFITTSRDAGVNFAPPVRYSLAAGSLFQDDEYAYEAQIVARPDGNQFFGAWNQADSITGKTAAEYASGIVTVTDDPTDPTTPPVSSGGGGGGCSVGDGKAPFDPSLLLLAALGLGGIALRRVRRQG
jgi:hypothetical protein